MQGAKGAALAKLVADKGKTKSKDEAKRAEVTTKIQGIFAATEADVKKILDGLDPKVEKEFEQGEAAARSAFEGYVAGKMSAYKKDRYGGWLGGLRWAKDKLLGMPDKVNEFYEAGRELYLKQMDGVISRVADIVAGDLTAAKQRIATGKAEIASYVKSLPTDLQKVGSEASKEIGEKFEQLENDVNAKQDAVVDTLATKYVEARKGLDERIEALQAENKGLVDKAIGAIKAVINTIRELAAMLKNVLSRVAGVVGDIIKNPIGFLSNLIAGIKGGILKFKDNILDHLRKGLMSWLFGALAEGGIELPGTFDVKGIIKLLASIFGLTWANIRNRLVKQIGEKAMAAAEKGVEIFQVIASQGVAGLWNMLLEKLGDIKEMILEQVKDFVITKIITAGITWLIGLLNPAAAFIKACKLIYDVVMFFVDNASRILKFVNTVIDSVADIVKGNVSGVVDKINDVLGQMVPIIIGFLASVIGIGGIGQKIRQIIETLQKPVNKALDFVIKTGLKLAGPIIRGIKGISGKVKAKVAAGKAWVKGKVDQGKALVKDKVKSLFPPIVKTFAMNGVSHRVTAEPGTSFQLTMASDNPGRLVSRIDFATAQLRRKAPGAGDQLAELAKLREFALVIEKTGARAEMGDSQAAKRLEIQLGSLSSRIVAYSARFKANDLDEIDPSNDVELTLRLAESAADKRRLSAIDAATIRLQIERIMGPPWKEFVTTLGPNMWTLTRESLIRVYGKTDAETMINQPDSPLDGKGLYDNRRNQLFIKMGRSISEIASSIMHEGTHSLQKKYGGIMEPFEKEFQAFSVQRHYLSKLNPEAQSKLPEDYKKLLRCDTDDKLKAFVAGKYKRFEVVEQLKQRADVQYVKQLVQQEFGR